MHIASLSSSSTCGNAYVVWSDLCRPILVDCGVPIKRLVCTLKEIGIDPVDIAGIFITHEHSDHVKAMCLVTPIAQKYHIPVYASQGFWNWYSWCASRVDKELMRPIRSGETVQVSKAIVQAFLKPHDAAEPLGFVVECEGERAGFAMDLGHMTDDIESRLTGLEHLVFESNHDVEMEKRSCRPWSLIQRVLGNLGHLSNDQAADALTRLVTDRTRQVILAHLSTECNTPELARSTVESRLMKAGKKPSIHVAPARELAVYRSPVPSNHSVE